MRFAVKCDSQREIQHQYFSHRCLYRSGLQIDALGVIQQKPLPDTSLRRTQSTTLRCRLPGYIIRIMYIMLNDLYGVGADNRIHVVRQLTGEFRQG